MKSAACSVYFSIIILCIALVAPLKSKAQGVSSPVLNEGYTAQPIVRELPASWSLKVDDSGAMWVSHRQGSLSYIDANGQLSSYTLNLPDLYYAGQGGLLDIILHPNFAENAWVYVSYSAGVASNNYLKVVRFVWQKDVPVIDSFSEIYTLAQGKDTPVNYGARLAFMPDQSLLISTGDGFDYREQAQNMQSHLGKIIRVSDTGEVLKDNPFYKPDEPLVSAIYSVGHRNPQGLLVSDNGKVIAHEHGPAGGDEVNFIEAGNNYGWPIITNGKDYIGASITPFREYAGMQQATYDWTPSIAPSGMIHYRGKRFADLQNSLLVSSLKEQQVYVLHLTTNGLATGPIILPNIGHRLRDITQDNNGNIYLLSDGENAQIFKLQQAE